MCHFRNLIRLIHSCPSNLILPYLATGSTERVWGKCFNMFQEVNANNANILCKARDPCSSAWQRPKALAGTASIQSSPHCKPRLIGIFGQCCRFLRLKNRSLRTQFTINSRSGSSLQGLEMEMLKPKSRALKLIFTTVGSTSCYLRSSAVSDMSSLFSLFSLFHFFIADLNPK